VILKGTGRVRTEASKPVAPSADVVLGNDVEIHDETNSASMKDRQLLIDEARNQLEKVLEGLERDQRVDDKLIEAATPKSREDWNEEHRQNTSEALLNVDAFLRP
jgi:hypothetical protein